MDIAPTGRKRPIVERVAGWSVRHRVIVVVSWLLIVVAAFAVGQHLGTSNTNSYDPGQAGRAERILNEPAVQQPDGESVLIQGRSAAQTFAGDPELRQTVRQVVAALKQLPDAATDIQSPFTSAGLANGRSALVTFNVAGKPANDDTAVVPALNAVAAIQARHPGLTVAEAGGASVDRTASAQIGQDFRTAAVTSLPVTLVLLLIVFGALIAAGIPLLLAGTAVIAAISLLSIPSRIVPIDGTTSAIVLLVGMAVGIDYSLFYLRRVREERAAGRDTKEALHVAAATSGRGVGGSGLATRLWLAGPAQRGGPPDRDYLAGRAVPDRDRRVLGGGDRRHPRPRRVRARLADVPARAAVAARHRDRPGQDPVPGPAPGRRPPVQALGSGRPRGGAPPAGAGRAGGDSAAGAGDAAAVAAPGEPGPARVPQHRAGDPHRRSHRAGLPRRPRAGRGGRDRRQPQRHRSQPRHRRPARAGRGDPRGDQGTHHHRALRGGPARSRPGAGHLGPAERRRHQRDQCQRAQYARHPGAPRHAGQGAGDQLRGRR